MNPGASLTLTILAKVGEKTSDSIKTSLQVPNPTTDEEDGNKEEENEGGNGETGNEGDNTGGDIPARYCPGTPGTPGNGNGNNGNGNGNGGNNPGIT